MMITALLTVFSLLPALSYAAGLPSQIVPCNGKDCTVCHIAELINRIVLTGLYLSAFFAALLFAYAGWLYMTSNHSKGQQIFTDVLIGFLIVLSAWLIIDTIMRVMIGSKSRLPWNQLC